eukprot:TRINITY_DN3590_c0_g1_i1.p1 TRINITY_DN3590_c0_g1~~TRINITY_DN3590_c0_g1_i1.p1  ORF type:complete len:384 (-),score=135.90 TRINITY_DN3590_c0_g1_i1:19-1059(-)
MAACPCSNQTLCEPITSGPRTEVFIFSVDDTNWDKYDWTQITTIVLFSTPYDPNVICKAHSVGARVVWGVNWVAAVSAMGDQSQRSAWINQQLQLVQSTFADGINIDFETSLTSDQSGPLTDLVQESTQIFHTAIPGSQVTFDVAWSPKGVDGRDYDYLGLSKACDFLFVMSYDLRSQLYTPDACYAGPNSDLELVQEGVQNFTDLGISPDLLVLGVPWYGFDYPCIEYSNNTCQIRAVPYHGAPCSDAGGVQTDYKVIAKTLQFSTPMESGWDESSASPFADIQMSGQVHQFWYDNPNSLALKSELANLMGLRGIGMWNADSVDYDNPVQSSSMWNTFKIVSQRD